MVRQPRQQAKFKALLAERAHFMRHNATEEEIFWRCVAGKRLGVAFRRQFVAGRHIVDLVAPAARLVVEVDGGWHSRRVAADERRERVLQRLGHRVLRLPGESVRCELAEAVGRVRLFCECAHSWRRTRRCRLIGAIFLARSIVNQSKQRIMESLDDLPSDSLAALAEFAEYLRAKALTPRPVAVVESSSTAALGGMFKGYRFEEGDFVAARKETWGALGAGDE